MVVSSSIQGTLSEPWWGRGQEHREGRDGRKVHAILLTCMWYLKLIHRCSNSDLRNVRDLKKKKKKKGVLDHE